LIPADDQTPTAPAACSHTSGEDFSIFFGAHNNVAVTRSFPHTVLTIHNNRVLALERLGDGSIAMNIDIRGPDGKIAFKLDSNGQTVGRNYEIYLQRPDASTLILINAFGVELLRVRYLNRRSFSVKGPIPYMDIQRPLDFGNFEGNCMWGAAVDIAIP
jgi:hypothetical protein